MTGTDRLIAEQAPTVESRLDSMFRAALGRLPDDAETFLARACPIVRSYGAKDYWTRGVALKLQQTLAAAGVAG